MADSPIQPEWIIAGDPVARCAAWSNSADSQLSLVVWECSAGTFRWEFGCDEVVHVLSGAVEVTDDDRSFTLRAGDTAFFPAGSAAVWHIEDHLRKQVVLRNGMPAGIGRLLRARARAAGAVRRVRASRSTDVRARVGEFGAEPVHIGQREHQRRTDLQDVAVAAADRDEHLAVS